MSKGPYSLGVRIMKGREPQIYFHTCRLRRWSSFPNFPCERLTTNTIRDILGHRRCSLYRLVSYERELQATWENHRMRKGV